MRIFDSVDSRAELRPQRLVCTVAGCEARGLYKGEFNEDLCGPHFREWRAGRDLPRAPLAEEAEPEGSEEGLPEAVRLEIHVDPGHAVVVADTESPASVPSAAEAAALPAAPAASPVPAPTGEGVPVFEPCRLPGCTITTGGKLIRGLHRTPCYPKALSNGTLEDIALPSRTRAKAPTVEAPAPTPEPAAPVKTRRSRKTLMTEGGGSPLIWPSVVLSAENLTQRWAAWEEASHLEACQSVVVERLATTYTDTIGCGLALGENPFAELVAARIARLRRFALEGE